jgi:1-acyl-sn-glycerol-3-phosphate acyltransferase
LQQGAMTDDSKTSLLMPHEQGLKLAYDHARLEPRRRFLRLLIREIGFRFLVRLGHVEGLEHVPPSGPAIVLINHIAFIDPIAVMHVLPRNVVPMAKREVYQFPVIGIFPRLWEVIPVHREGVDRRAIRRALEVLRAGEMVLIAPEGTRSPALKQAREGVAYLAARTGAPVLPVAVDDTIGFPTHPFAARWRGPGVSIRIGAPFRYRSDLLEGGGLDLRLMTDEAMAMLASILPDHRRGFYADWVGRPLETIEAQH